MKGRRPRARTTILAKPLRAATRLTRGERGELYYAATYTSLVMVAVVARQSFCAYCAPPVSQGVRRAQRGEDGGGKGMRGCEVRRERKMVTRVATRIKEDEQVVPTSPSGWRWSQTPNASLSLYPEPSQRLAEAAMVVIAARPFAGRPRRG